MKIGNIRVGFATNSSSTHSIVIVKDPSKITENNMCDYGEFWRENFVLTNKTSKIEYLAALLFTSYEDIIGSKLANLLINDFFSIKGELGGVDHQSAIGLPLTRNNEDIEIEFVKEFRDFITNKNVVILGGDDNQDDEDFKKLGTDYKNLELPVIHGVVWAKKQKDGWWTLFAKEKGAKVTFNFNTNAEPLVKARTPDLIDLKITDYCESGCQYCYQNSSKKGGHADIEIIRTLLHSFNDMEVFEIAIGGGEPTKHPHFADILYMAKDLYMIPNFSTRSFDWMKNANILCAVKSCVGKIGFSCSTLDEVRALLYHSEKSGLNENNFTVHYVLGSSPIDELGKMVELISYTNVGILLLGYKEVGRGCKFTPYDNSGWSKLFNKYFYGSLGIDTSVAKQYKKELKKLKVNEVLYFSEEGKFSMYIDAVEKKVGRSSFEKNPEDYTNIGSLNNKRFEFLVSTKELMEIFNGY